MRLQQWLSIALVASDLRPQKSNAQCVLNLFVMSVLFIEVTKLRFFMFLQSCAPRYGHGDFFTFWRRHIIIEVAYASGASGLWAKVLFLNLPCGETVQPPLVSSVPEPFLPLRESWCYCLWQAGQDVHLKLENEIVSQFASRIVITMSSLTAIGHWSILWLFALRKRQRPAFRLEDGNALYMKCWVPLPWLFSWLTGGTSSCATTAYAL